MQLQKLPSTHLSVIPKAVSIQEVKIQLDQAIHEAQRSLSDKYDEVAIFCCHWNTDDTGSDQDCKLFSETMSVLFQTCKVQCIYSIQEEEDYEDWLTACNETRMQLDKQKRTLFIFFYAGHATKSSTSSSLILTARFEEAEEDGICKTQRDSTILHDALMRASRANPLLDVLMVVDSCCAAVGGRRNIPKSGRVEFIAATTETGISNTRKDGQTFTKAFCKAVKELSESREDFSTDDIVAKGLPISFLKPINDAVVVPSVEKPTQLPVVLVAFHLAESPSDDAVSSLTNWLVARSNIPISVLATLSADSTLLLIELPELLLDFLHLNKQCYVTLWPPARNLVVDRNNLHTVLL
ncbi:hypothetical protein MP228_003005 [Amoeboaphelidium protococcarum]|nr:hypothetical protein MP228_003005 [Amoeboaphelidium protococcarum]